MERTTISRKKIKLRHLLGCSIIIAAVYLIITAGAPAYTVPLAEERLNNLAENLSRSAKVSGQDARMHYNSLSLDGFGQNTHGVVARWSLDILRQSWLNVEKLTFSSENVHLVPNHLAPDSTLLQFTQLMNVIAGSELLYSIQASPTAYYLLRTNGNKDNYDIHHNIWLPEKGELTIRDQENNLSIRLGQKFIIDATLKHPYTNLVSILTTGSIEAKLHEKTWKATNGNLRINMVKKTPRVIESKGTFTLDNVTVQQDDHDSTPANFNIAWLYKEIMSMNGAVESSELEIERSMLTDDVVKVAASGRLYFSVEDNQPYGEIVLEINDIKLLAESGWIKGTDRADFENVLEAMIGQALEHRTQEIITIQREQGGEWKCGKIACQTLINQGMLGGSYKNKERNHGKKSSDYTAETS